MPEFRHDPVVGYWTIISTERSRRPVEFRPRELPEERRCPFCEGREDETTPEAFAIRKMGTTPDGPGWDVRVIVSKMPLLSESGPAESCSHGLYDRMDGIGRHEIIVESPRHAHDLDELDLPAIEKVIRAYVNRLNAFKKDESVKYALLFKNHGLISGSVRDVIRHSRSQLITLPVIPKRVKEELASTKAYFEREGRCVFCDILKQEKNEAARVVSENKTFLAFCPFASRSPFEMWILPKEHEADFGQLPPKDFHDFALILKECLIKLHDLLEDPPFNLVLHTAPYRHKTGDYHWYLQIAPRLTKNAGFEWGTGIHINPTPPEDAALLLRQTKVRHARTS
ncbi:MAG: galactose-1-phosphate uridylyltransferase [Candidatus Omnitrophica bacterium]|nr:galactose-1-phosphate uridylyltransferase [Candidatus Omnitrophota bacterium]